MDYSPENFYQEMQKLSKITDYEERHQKMDDLMCSYLKALGYGSGVDVFEDTEKYYI